MFREKYANPPQKSAEKYALFLQIFLILQIFSILEQTKKRKTTYYPSLEKNEQK